MFILYGVHPVEGPLEQNFTLNERETALHVAVCFNQRHWKPILVQRNYRGEEVEVYSYKRKVAA
jgi:hypothetical protein